MYALIIKDRHTDVEVQLFHHLDNAIAAARAAVHELARHPEYIEEEAVDGYVYYCRYSTEGDSVHVEEVEIEDEP